MSLWKKKTAEPAVEEVVDSAAVGTAADVEAVMKKYDRESNTRVWEGKPKLLVKALMIGFSLYCLYLTLFDTSLPEFRLAMFLGLIVIIGYLTNCLKDFNQSFGCRITKSFNVRITCDTTKWP
jgi:TRAP-type uncharacterized transport system fused permease subunit